MVDSEVQSCKRYAGKVSPGAIVKISESLGIIRSFPVNWIQTQGCHLDKHLSLVLQLRYRAIFDERILLLGPVQKQELLF